MIINTDAPIKAESYGRVRRDKELWHNGRTLDTNLFVFVESGFLKMMIGNDVFDLKKGDILLIPANTFYRPLKVSKLEYYFIHFIADVTTENRETLHMSFNPTLPEGDFEFNYWGGHPTVKINTLTHTTNNDDVRNILNKIASLNIRNNEQKLLLDCYLRELIINISDQITTNNGVSYNMARIIKFIDSNYEENITLSNLAEKFKLSESYIARLFKNELNTSSTKYINKIRIINACRMLLCTTKTIGEISESLGYKDQYYFTRIFKSYCKTTPSEYRKNRIVT